MYFSSATEAIIHIKNTKENTIKIIQYGCHEQIHITSSIYSTYSDQTHKSENTDKVKGMKEATTT
jgi:hypothetical protein